MATKTKDNAAAGHQPVGKNISETRRVSRLRRHARLRKKIAGTAERPRLVVHRSSRHIHVQLVDDLAGATLAAASSIEADVRAPNESTINNDEFLAARAVAPRHRLRW